MPEGKEVKLYTASPKVESPLVIQGVLPMLVPAQTNERYIYRSDTQGRHIVRAYPDFVVSTSGRILHQLADKGLVESSVMSFAVDEVGDVRRFFRGGQRFRRDRFSVRGGVLRDKDDQLGSAQFLGYQLHNAEFVPAVLNRQARVLLGRNFSPLALDFAKRVGGQVDSFVANWDGLVDFKSERDVPQEEVMDGYAQILRDFGIRVLPYSQALLENSRFSENMVNLYKTQSWAISHISNERRAS